MSEVQSRPSAPRGRGSARGGRGGFSSRGGRGSRVHGANGDRAEAPAQAAIEDDSEVGQLKKEFGNNFAVVKDIYPDWTDEDIVFALQETNNDLDSTVAGIADGTIAKWGAVPNKKDKTRAKAQDATVSATLGEQSNSSRGARGGRGGFEGRGRGRGIDRGRGGRGRGASSVPHTNGTKHKENEDISVPTTESNAWNTADTADTWTTTTDAKDTSADSWANTTTDAVSKTAAAATQAASSIIPEGAKKSWASMFKQPAVPKEAPAPAPKPAEEPPKAPEVEETPAEPEVAQPEPAPEVPAELPVETPPAAEETKDEKTEADLTPSKDDLTETNLEQVPDMSGPPLAATAASTAASSWDPRNNNTATPFSAAQLGPQPVRPSPTTTSGYAASAMKAAGSSGRVPSYQRQRILDQEEAVRMPGNRDVDRAAVQFGAFNLNGAGDDDVDGDREEPETRAQPPQHSPVTHPRASLPPAPPAAPAEQLPTPKQAPGLPAPSQPTSAPGLPSPQDLSAAQTGQQAPQANQPYNQYGRYGQPGAQEPSSFGQKPYDAFGQQTPASQSAYEGFQNQGAQSQAQQQPGAFSSAPSEYSQYYTADAQRNAYQNYYGQGFGGPSQAGQGQQDGPASQQRSASGFPSQADTSQYPQSSTQTVQSRFATAGEGQTSGHSTPNPSAQALQQQPSQSAQPAQGGLPQQPPGQQYPYGHPYFSSPYYAAYMTQQYNSGGYGQGNYGMAPYGGAKAGMYNQPHQYGISPHPSYDAAASPAAGAFAQSALHGRESAVGGGLGDYGRSAATPSSQPLGGSSAFGGMHDPFGRTSSYQGQAQHYGQQGQAAATDDLKPFGADSAKAANGPSPSITQAARPGSAANNAPGQSGLPPPQSQQGYGGYPNHLQQQHALHGSQSGSQYSGLGGLGGHQAGGQAGHQASQYGGYGQHGFGGGSYYGNNQQRGGWGGNYGGH